MSFKYKSLSFFVAFAFSFISCQREHAGSDIYHGKKIENYPCLFSYKTDSLRIALQSKANDSLVNSEIDNYFAKDAFDNTERTADLLHGGKFKVFPLHKIIYSKSALAIYLVKGIEEEYSPDKDMISVVMYDKVGKPANCMNVDLLNSFGWKEINFISPLEFEVLEFDEEYSPDFESEAEDIKNGIENVPLLITSLYEIDTVGLKFIKKDSWQIDVPRKKELAPHTEVCFESTSPNASRATPLYEYLKISWLNDSVWGTGAGDFMAGSEPWTLSFTGKFYGTDIKLNISYKQEGKASFSINEVWTLDLKKERLYRKDWSTSNNLMGAAEYHGIACDEIPQNFKNIDPQ